jgi:nicotinate phosphoribosyltransferase
LSFRRWSLTVASFDLKDRRFWMATEGEILDGTATDAYFSETKQILERKGIDTPVSMEAYATGLPYEQNWAVLCGVYEVAKLLEGKPVDVWAFDEGSVFLSDSRHAIYEPILRVTGRYRDFVEYETAILGFLCSATSVATRAARFRRAAGPRLLLSYGTRRVHPALAPVIERACYLAGFDGVSNVAGARLLEKEPSGTMPHALIQTVGDPAEAFRLFDQVVAPSVPRVALVDTFSDERVEAIAAWTTLGRRLWGVRLDTPATRRGDFRKILEEVRWELNIRGGRRVRLFASGRLHEEDVESLRDLVDGFGIGTSVAYPPLIDFSLKIVEASGSHGREFRSKRGGLSGAKQVYRSRRGIRDTVRLASARAPPGRVPMLRPLLHQGGWVRPYEGLRAIRERVASGLKELTRGPVTLDSR